MNTNLKLLAALIMGGALAACGGSSSDDGPNNSSSSTSSSSSSSSSSDAVDCEANPFDPACIEEDPVTEIDITNEDIPLHETFAVTGDGNQVAQFFSTDYKELNTAGANEDYVDDHPSFYYPTCCFWETDETTGEPNGNLVPDIDVRQYVGTDSEGNGYFAFSNARWSIGQLQPDIVSDEESEDNDAKSKTTNAPVGSSWGELDLSVPYRISFCLKDSGLAGAGTGGNLEVYVDNNSGGNQGHSIHGNQSLLMRTEAAALTAGNRVVIDVPGDVRLQDNNGEQVDLISTTAEVYGTENSFLQMRVSSGGYVVINDLMIEHQDNLVGDYTPCEADESLFTPPLPEGFAFPGLPLNEDFEDITKEQLIGDGDDIAGEFMAVSSDPTIPFYKFNSTGRLAITEAGELHISNNRFTMGFAGVENTAEGDTEVAGDIDLSEPYTLTLEISERPASDEGRLQVLVDNSTTGSANSIHGENSVLLGTTWGLLGTGTLEINVPGDVLLNNEPVLDENGDPVTIDAHYGTETSFLQIWCPSDCGADIESAGFGVKFDSIMLDNQDLGGDPNAIWAADSYVLAGGTTDADGSVVEETESSMTITATGGKTDSSSDLNMFLASQQTDMGDFAFTARIVNVTGADLPEGNGRRFGIMAIADLTPAGAGGFDDLGAWAGMGFYADGDPVGLIGSRAYLKPAPGASRSRSNIDGLELGHYVRIEIFDDGENKRVRHCTSVDGQTWVSQNSTTDFMATAATDSWHYGVYAAPGENEITMEVDSISIEPYVAACDAQ